MTRFKSISHSHRFTWNAASSTRLGRGILLRLQPRPRLQASKNTMNFTILVPWFWLGDILRIGFWYGCDFFGYRSDERHLWSGQKEVVFVVHVALYFYLHDNMCEAYSQANIPVPLTRFIVNWTPWVLSLEYYHQLFDTRLSFWTNNPGHLQILQIQKLSLHVTSIDRFKGQACSETYEYRNTFSGCRHTSIYNRLKAIVSGKPFSFTNSLVSSFLRIMFMRLYFRIMFLTSHYCLCSFIIN